MPDNILDASCRVAFAALSHDLGKFAERAAPEVAQDRLDAHITNYAKRNDQRGGYHSHRHAAWTALFMETIEDAAPDLIGKTGAETAPFAGRRGDEGGNITDCLINAAAMHHRPETLLQWIIATADRVASGFEREEFERYNDGEDKTDTGRNHYQARLLTLFEQVSLAKDRPAVTSASLHYRYPLKPLAPETLFPVRREDYEPDRNEPAQVEYQALWQAFLKALQDIPRSHRKQWPLWLDHFDTLWQIFTHAIPSATAFNVRPDVSLYDHSKTTAALGVALWRWHIAQTDLSEEEAIRRHRERADWDTPKFLLVQGDFFGIQDFIFAEGADTNQNAAKLLRGRSFQVSLFTELAALKVLEACELPATSQITNAAGKFLIVAPNTDAVREKLDAARRELNDWFLQNTFGLAGLGLAVKETSCNDFLAGRFEGLMKTLFGDLERAKLARFDLTDDAPKVFQTEYPLGVCQYNNRLPADESEGENKASARLSRDQVEIGKALAHQDRLLVTRDGADLRAGSVTLLETPVFGYRIGFTRAEEITGKFGELAQAGQMLRCWDFSLPENLQGTLWHGYARRYINAHVPHFSTLDQQTSDKYREAKADDADPHAPKTFNHLACEDRILNGKGKWIGQIALVTLKGDVDNLGRIFQQGLSKRENGERKTTDTGLSFARMAALSRQMNAFFAVWLPAYCEKKYPNTYTIFAGGDDFFLIGPWHSTQRLAADMSREFQRFVAENSEIHFSAGMVMIRPGYPIHTLAERAENALGAAKGYETNTVKEKNAVCLHGEIVPWAEWEKLSGLEREIHALADEYKLSTGYIYGLLYLIDLAASKTTESSLWRSRFVYRNCRYVVDKLPKEARATALARLATTLGKNGIEEQQGRLRIPLFNFFYSKR
jgi:CRISPR-associated protein Csm1